MSKLDMPMVCLNLYAQHFEIMLAEFYEICLILYDGELREPLPEEFEGFLCSLTMGEYRGVSRARVTSLPFPVMHYFGLFIGKCLIAREEGGTHSVLDLAI